MQIIHVGNNPRKENFNLVGQSKGYQQDTCKQIWLSLEEDAKLWVKVIKENYVLEENKWQSKVSIRLNDAVCRMVSWDSKRCY